MPKLSVILITRNESAQIVDCLESVRFADEWIVVDGGSTDDTVEQARAWGAQVYVHPEWHGFGRQKNLALSYATGKWVLSIDADERVTPDLAAEIQRVVRDSSGTVAYTMPRLSSYCGRFMRHGGWWPDRVLRLFLRDAGKFAELLVHESVVVNGPVKKLRGHLVHYSYASLESVIEKMNLYTTAGAEAMRQRGRQAGVLQAVLHAAWAFWRGYVLRGGFLDGAQGLMAAVSSAESTYYRYIKRWFMEQRPGFGRSSTARFPDRQKVGTDHDASTAA